MTSFLLLTNKSYAVNIPENIAKGKKTIEGELLVDERSWDAVKFKVNPYHGINSEDFTISSNLSTFKVEILEFNNNTNIEFLPIKINQNFLILEKYLAVNCAIKKISYENFKGLFNLRDLHLVNNQIEVIQSGLFDDLINFMLLNLNGNKINFIADDAFTTVKTLKLLFLERNQLTTLSFALPQSLTYFSVKENQISTIPKGFLSHNKKLSYFIAGSNKIKSIPRTTFGRMWELGLVDLSNNTCIDYMYHGFPYDSRTLKNLLKKNCDIEENDDGKISSLVYRLMECTLDFSLRHCLLPKTL